MTSFHPSGGPEALIDDVVGVELTVDGMLVVADRLGWATSRRFSDPPQHPVSGPVQNRLGAGRQGPDRAGCVVGRRPTPPGGCRHAAHIEQVGSNLEGRWWRRDRGGEMTRFAVSRRADRHVIAVRHGELVALQRVASKVGLVSMVTAVLGSGEPAEVEPPTALAATLAQCRTAEQLGQFDIGLASARTYAALIDQTGKLVGDHRRPAASRRHGEPHRGRRGRARRPSGADRVNSAPG